MTDNSKTFQLFKIDNRTQEVSKACTTWTPMTEKEADTTRTKMSPSEKYSYFVAPISEWKELL